jgi:hypothetical protein
MPSKGAWVHPKTKKVYKDQTVEWSVIIDNKEGIRLFFHLTTTLTKMSPTQYTFGIMAEIDKRHLVKKIKCERCHKTFTIMLKDSKNAVYCEECKTKSKR